VLMPQYNHSQLGHVFQFHLFYRRFFSLIHSALPKAVILPRDSPKGAPSKYRLGGCRRHTQAGNVNRRNPYNKWFMKMPTGVRSISDDFEN
jgi:hypothetical protein